MKWIKASEKLPSEGGRITWRWMDSEAAYTGYTQERGFIYDTGGASVDPLYNIEIEWLDESQPSEPSFTLKDMIDAHTAGTIAGNRQVLNHPLVTQEEYFKEKYGIDINQK